ncbi:hypothetical protein SteCoe_34246 [Stentor coeruleus]|uniref:Uncharacterized protein n=1 Tax=Stentor coeruleus TaxID=5963 RepID=A0A1R2AUZ7_9CILI|nr:hypothetical protein SteCoe_34246 [Stentor coeruleus]
MNELQGIITKLEGEVATILYSTENASQNYDTEINSFEIEGIKHCSEEEKRLYVKIDASIKIVYENNIGKILITKPELYTLFGKIDSVNEEAGTICVSVFKEEGLYISPIYSVFIENQPVNWETVRNYMNFPVEILMNRNSCVKVTFITKIPFEILATYHSINEKYLFLQTKYIKYRVLSSSCFYSTFKNSIETKKLEKMQGKTVKIIVCLSAYRVEFENPIKKQNLSIDLAKEKRPNNKNQGMRVFFADYLQELKKFKDLLQWRMYSNEDINYDLQFTIYIGMLETFLLTNDCENIQRLLKCNKKFYKQLEAIIKADYIFNQFYNWIEKEFEELKVYAKENIKPGIDFEQISQEYPVSFNVFAVIKDNVMNSFYGRIDKNPVINLLIIDNFSAVIYSPNDLIADGFDIHGNETGQRTPKNDRYTCVSGLNENSFYHLLKFMSQTIEKHSRNSSQSSVKDDCYIVSKITDMISDDNKTAIDAVIKQVLLTGRK